jgi:hypothetical protein
MAKNMQVIWVWSQGLFRKIRNDVRCEGQIRLNRFNKFDLCASGARGLGPPRDSSERALNALSRKLPCLTYGVQSSTVTVIPGRAFARPVAKLSNNCAIIQ